MAGPGFDAIAAGYDAWFDRPPGSLVFPGELEALLMAAEGAPRPWIEVGCGTGRFAAALGVDWGVDPARGMLRLAAGRGVAVLQGDGFCLPMRDGRTGSVFIITALCFVADPPTVLREAHRVLRPGGAVVLADIPAGSPWGQHYAAVGAAGHAVYRHARFFGIPRRWRSPRGCGARPHGAHRFGGPAARAGDGCRARLVKARTWMGFAVFGGRRRSLGRQR